MYARAITGVLSLTRGVLKGLNVYNLRRPAGGEGIHRMEAPIGRYRTGGKTHNMEDRIGTLSDLPQTMAHVACGVTAPVRAST